MPSGRSCGGQGSRAAKPFLRRPKVRWDELPITGPWGFPANLPSEDDMRPFTQAELFKGGNRLLSGKIQGPDAVHNEILKILLREDPNDLLMLFNVC